MLEYEEYDSNIENPEGKYIPIIFKIFKDRTTRSVARDEFWKVADAMAPKDSKGNPMFGEKGLTSTLIRMTYGALKKRHDLDFSKITKEEFIQKEKEKEEAERLVQEALRIKAAAQATQAAAAEAQRLREEAAIEAARQQEEYDAIHGRQGKLDF